MREGERAKGEGRGEGESGKKERQINDDGAVGGGGGGGPEGALDHLKPGAQVWLSDTGVERGEKEGCAFCEFIQTVRLVLLVMLKPAVNEAASLQRRRESKKRERAACLTLKRTNESASWSCGVVCLEIVADCFEMQKCRV